MGTKRKDSVLLIVTKGYNCFQKAAEALAIYDSQLFSEEFDLGNIDLECYNYQVIINEEEYKVNDFYPCEVVLTLTKNK